MDSTLFEYKGTLNEAPGTFSNNPNKLKTPRPASAQAFKINSHLVSPTFMEAPKIGFPTHSLPSNRNRPVSAIKSPNKMMQNDSSMKNLHYIIPGDIRPEEDARLIEKVANGEPMQMPDIQKLMPRNIKFDKERLYEDTLHLKQTNNNLRDENMRLKTKNLNLERENIKLVRCLERAGNVPVEPGRQNESALMAALKKQVKDLKDDNKLREEELELIKRNIKFTKFQELEVELKAYADENIRITGLFDELLRAKPHVKQEDYNSLEEQYHMQNGLVDSLQRENSRLTAEIKFLEDTNYNLQVTRELDLKNIQKQQAEVGKLRKQLKEKETKPAQNLRPESATAKTSQRVEDKAKVEEENNELKKLLEHRDQMIHQRDKALEDLKLKFNDRMINDAKEKQNLAHEINNLKDQLTDLESKYRAVVNIHHPAEENKRRSPEGRASPKYDEDLPSDSRIERSLAFESKAKKVKKVRLEDVSTLGYELSLRLRVRRIVLEEIMKFLERFGPKISIFEMKNLLAHDPFGIKDENNALLIARYLIEPNDDEILTFDVNRTQDLSIIKSVFRKLVGSYTLLSEEEEKVMNTEVGEIIHKFEQGLLTQFTIMPESKTGYLSSEQILKAFKMIDIAITPKNFEYLIMNLYEYTGSLKKLDYNKMFEIFETEEHKRLKRIIEMYQNQNDMDSDRSERKVKFKDDEERKTQPNSPEKKPRHNLEDFDGEDDDNFDEEEEDDEGEGEDEGEEEGEEEDEAEEGNQTK